MKITDIDHICNTFHYYASIRSRYLDCAQKCTKDFAFSLNVDGRKLCDLLSLDNEWLVPLVIENILFRLVFEADSSLRSFCNDHDIEYEPIEDKLYIQWLDNQFQSK